MQEASETPGSRLRAWRIEKGLTVAEAGHLLSCSATFVSMIERGDRKPGRAVANAIEKQTNRAIRATDWDLDSAA